MLQHFFHPIVLIAYVVLVVLNALGLVLVNPQTVMLQSAILLIVDYTVHRGNHNWKWITPPWMSILWIALIIVFTGRGLVHSGWQLATIFFAQMWWDNSWHSVFHHRVAGKSTTHTDYWAIRFGAIIAVTLVMF